MTPSPMETRTMTKPTATKGLRIALALSVAVNLAVLGLVAGVMLRDGPGMRGAMVRDLGFGPYTEALRPEDRKELRHALFEKAPEILETRRLMREDMQALLALLRADPFDAAAFRQQMEAQHIRMQHQLQLGQGLLQDFIAAMPAEERRAFADRLEAGLRHHSGHEDDDHDDHDDDKDRDDGSRD